MNNFDILSGIFNARRICTEMICSLEEQNTTNSNTNKAKVDRLCGLVVRVSGYRYRGPGFDRFSE